MTNHLCSVEDCNREVHVAKRELCSSHYQQWARRNKPNGEKPCSVEGCGRFHYAKGYCNLHYANWKRCGNPTPVREKKMCENHPDRQAHSVGMCKSCYQKWYYWNGPTGTGIAGNNKKEVVLYEAAHLRIRAARGRAAVHDCTYNSKVCTGQAQEWALRHDAEEILECESGRMIGSLYSPNPNDYTPMCTRCHRRYDSQHGEGPKRKKSKRGEGPRNAEYLARKARQNAA